MASRFRLQDLTFSAVIAGFVAVLVGYTSSAAIIFQAAEAAGASVAQIGGWLSMLGLGMGVTSIGLSLYYRTPVVTAWSTPGAALLVTQFAWYIGQRSYWGVCVCHRAYFAVWRDRLIRQIDAIYSSGTVGGDVRRDFVALWVGRFYLVTK